MSDAQQKRAREITLIKRAMAVTSVYMLAEIIIGYQFNVLSLVADSYHMMNDIAAFIVQLYADELGNLDRRHAKDSTAFSFGFGRVEILANLIQGTLLLALCLTLCLESVQRFYGPETIALPPIVVGMGVAGLVWNIIMFRLFEEAHHGHAHSLAHPLRYRQRLGNAAVQGPFRLARAASSRSSVEFSPGKSPWSKIPKAQIKAAFQPQNSLAIHAFADAIGNIAVIIDGLGSWLFGPKSGKTSGIVKTFKGISYLDPICSLVVVYLILTHAFPLVTKSSFFLMHAFDPVKTSSIKRALNNQNWVPGSLRAYLAVELEDLHIWSMNDKSRFATVRILVSPRGSYHLSALELVKLEEAAKGVMGEVGPPDQIHPQRRKLTLVEATTIRIRTAPTCTRIRTAPTCTRIRTLTPIL
ncbi:hypothetical protein JCM11641_007098 [Rhodosporidiobolus odoratus]